MQRVDLALVLAVDASSSVDRAEFDLMIGGYAAAFRDAEIAAALLAGPAGASAIAMLFWSGERAQEIAIPWQVRLRACRAWSRPAPQPWGRGWRQRSRYSPRDQNWHGAWSWMSRAMGRITRAGNRGRSAISVCRPASPSMPWRC
jgi:hypothetical protein